MQEIKDKQESSAQSRNDRNGSAAIAQKELTRYAACVFEPTDIVEVRRLPSGRSTWYQAGKLAEAAESLLNDNQHSQHIYVGANPRRVRGGTRGKDVACARCLFVDFDGIDPDTARDRWHNAGLPIPTLTIASGHGVHAYWRLAEPITDLSLWSGWQKRLIALLDSDGAIHDPPRLMRLPGFINHKLPVAMCNIIDDDPARIYDLNSLTPLLKNVIGQSGKDKQSQQSVNLARQPKIPFCNDLSIIDRAALTAAKWEGVSKGQRNSTAFQHAAYLVKNLALTEEQAWSILQQWNVKNKPPLPERELRQALRNASIYGRHPVGSKVAPQQAIKDMKDCPANPPGYCAEKGEAERTIAVLEEAFKDFNKLALAYEKAVKEATA